jgi:hypothetical protein
MDLNSIDPSLMLASTIWGLLGTGFVIYGVRYKSFVPLAGGLLLMVISYLAPTALSMSAMGLGLVAMGYGLKKMKRW